MIKAGALFYSIIISLIIAFSSSSLILSAYLTRIEFESFEMENRLNLNADSGLRLLLSKQSLVELNQPIVIDLFQEGVDSVLLTRKLWGAYEIAISKAVFKSKTAMRVAQVGFPPDPDGLFSLYMTDEDKPLALCGTTLIKGTAYLPKSGVKRAYIEGQSFSGNTLIEGAIKASEKNIPSFNKELLENLKSIFSNKLITDNDSVLKITGNLAGDSINNSFQNKTLIFFSSEPVIVSKGIYSGNIVIISDKEINISQTAILKDVLLFSPKIFIQEGFKGNFQAFASDTIKVDEKVTLAYPSVLGLVKSESSLQASVIILNENDTIAGNIFVCKDEINLLPQAGLIISEKAVIIGQVYSNGFVDIKGSINGSLTCNKIVLSTASSVYENHLLNAVIDVSKLPKQFTGINLAEQSEFKKVVKWLN